MYWWIGEVECLKRKLKDFRSGLAQHWQVSRYPTCTRKCFLANLLPFNDMEVNRTYRYRFYWPFTSVHGFPGNGCACEISRYQAAFSPSTRPGNETIHVHTFTPAHLHTFTTVYLRCTPAPIHTNIPTHIHTSTPAHFHTNPLHTFSTPAHLHTFTHLHQHTCTHSHQHTCTLSHIYTSTPAHIHTSTPAHIHTSTPAHIHTSTSAHIHTRLPTLWAVTVHLSSSLLSSDGHALHQPGCGDISESDVGGTSKEHHHTGTGRPPLMYAYVHELY